MIKVFFATIFLALCSIAMVNAQSTAPIKFDTTLHDFGTIQESAGKVSHTFTYVNTSDSPTVIIDVAVSCGCTRPIYSREPLMPGKSASLTIEFDPNNRPGRIDKAIYVVTDRGQVVLHIDGKVNSRPRTLEERYPFIIGGARLDGLGFTALQVPIAGVTNAQIGVANANHTVPVTVSVQKNQLPKNIDASLKNPTLRPREQSLIDFTIQGQQYGYFTVRIRLNINGIAAAELVTVAGAVVDNFAQMSDTELLNAPQAEFSTHYLRLGRVTAGQQREATIEIQNRGKSPLIIRQIESSTQIKAKIADQSIAPNCSTTLHIIYNQSLSGYDSGVVRLIVNDPRNPTPEIRFVATVE